MGPSQGPPESPLLLPTFKSVLQQQWCLGSPSRSLVHCYGALYWKALRRTPLPGQPGRAAAPGASLGQSRRAEGGLSVAVNCWSEAFSLESMEHNRLHDPRMQSAPQVPYLPSQSCRSRNKPLCPDSEMLNDSGLPVLEAHLGHSVCSPARPHGAGGLGGRHPQPGIYAATVGKGPRLHQN